MCAKDVDAQGCSYNSAGRAKKERADYGLKEQREDGEGEVLPLKVMCLHLKATNRTTVIRAFAANDAR